MPIPVEICIHSASEEAAREAVAAAYEGGAARVELCAAMEVGGMTPPVEHIRTAREAFGERPGLVVMIRPHGGDFCYTTAELARMAAEIRAAADAGADGVALGALRPDATLDLVGTRMLADTAHGQGLKVTFHRAFDALADPPAALDDLAWLGIDRVLTAGIPWGASGSALDGLSRLQEVVRRAAGRLEVVVGGGVNRGNAGAILRALPPGEGAVSVHAYSGAQEAGRTTATAVRGLVKSLAIGSAE